MDFTGFTNSLPATPDEHDDECPHCCGVVRVHHNGLCLGCLVQAGLSEDEGSESDNLGTLLSEIE
jgi:hypothetical protein